jgi:hypothetical protein
MFGRFLRKWHSVKWRSGDRRVNLSIHFDTRAPKNGNGDARPEVEKRPGRLNGRPGQPVEPLPAEDQIVTEVLEAVEEFNKRNRTSVRVAAIRYQADDTTGHREAARMLLNRM